MHNQVYAFVIFILNGFLIGLLFDIFRILRKTFKTPNFITYIEDIIFWILSGIMLLYSIFKFNNGELRAFIFIGVFLGTMLYMLVFSKLLINVSMYIINTIKIILNIIIVIPIKFIIKILTQTIYKPTMFLCINLSKLFKKIMSFFKGKTKSMLFINRKFKNRKDFTWICRIILYRELEKHNLYYIKL